MRIIPAGIKYESRIYVIDEDKLITKLYCNCYDFKNKKIYKNGSSADTKFYSKPCKHLKPCVEALERIGYSLKKPVEQTGERVLRAALRKELIERCNNMCENRIGTEICKNPDNLQVHRKRRGSNGGLYNLKNCIVLCDKCHKQIHGDEF